VRNLEIGRIRGCLGDRPIQEQCRRWVAAPRPQKTTRWTGLATCIPQTINEHTASGQYLAQRSDLIANLAQHIRHHAGYDGTPACLGAAGYSPGRRAHRVLPNPSLDDRFASLSLPCSACFASLPIASLSR